jgi:hypothetical protein
LIPVLCVVTLVREPPVLGASNIFRFSGPRAS